MFPAMVSRLPGRLVPFVKRELREQFAGSVLGLLWTVIQPIIQVLLFWWVFAEILQMRLPARGGTGGEIPFAMFLLTGLLPWFAFNEGIQRGLTSVVNRRDVVCYSRFPVILLPLATVSASFVVFMSVFGVLILLWWAGPGTFSATVFFALVWLAVLQYAAASAAALFFSALLVYLRDLSHAVGLFLMVVFYTAPVIYPIDIIPEVYRPWVMLNPFAFFAVGYRDLILWGSVPPVWQIGLATAVTAVLLYLASRFFRRLQPGFPDVL